jgi:hypothetical protein
MADIELRIQKLEQLFDTLDPAPFHDKALDRNVDAYLLESAAEYSASTQLTVVIYAPAEMASDIADIERAIHTHFALATQQAERRHRRRRAVGRLALFAGLAILVLALSLRSWLKSVSSPFAEAFSEGLMILAWVALWRPIETIGFDSWEAMQQRRLLAKLAKVPVRHVAN